MALVLIIEDNPMNRDVLGRRLERRGFEVRFAEDGPSGIEAARQIQPALILMDIGLGEMDGCEATRRIKADNPAHSHHCPDCKRIRVRSPERHQRRLQ
jgi:two-component system, cell cycle response regulator DivK